MPATASVIAATATRKPSPPSVKERSPSSAQKMPYTIHSVAPTKNDDLGIAFRVSLTTTWPSVSTPSPRPFTSRAPIKPASRPNPAISAIAANSGSSMTATMMIRAAQVSANTWRAEAVGSLADRTRPHTSRHPP